MDAQGIDYFENLCLSSNQGCKGVRNFQTPRIGVPLETVSQYVNVHYYADKELHLLDEASCKLACERENEFLCRSFVFKGASIGNQYNCQLFHLDHKTLPDGPSTYLRTERPLLDNGAEIGAYYENVCESKSIISFENLNFLKKLFFNYRNSDHAWYINACTNNYWWTRYKRCYLYH